MAVKGLGKVTVTSAGARARATKNQSDPTARISCQSVQFQALPSNTGIVYVGDSTVVGSTLVGTFAAIPAPASGTTGAFASQTFTIVNAPGGINLADFYLDVSVSGEGVLISYTEQ